MTKETNPDWAPAPFKARCYLDPDALKRLREAAQLLGIATSEPKRYHWEGKQYVEIK